MIAKTGLLVVSNPKQIGKILLSVKKQVKSTLYIQLLSALTDPFGSFHPAVYSTWPKYSKAIKGIYAQAAACCRHLDVRVLLSGIKYKDVHQVETQRPIDLVIFDKPYSQTEIDSFLNGRIANVGQGCEVLTLDGGKLDELLAPDSESDKIYSHTVLGGTFDRLHIAHKLLLTEAVLRSNKKVTVGVTEENMLESKILWEIIDPVKDRVHSVSEFLKDICPQLEINVVPISDPFGPTQNDPTMELLVVSSETLKGGQKVNEVRQINGLDPLDVISVELIDEPSPKPNEELKISSSSARMRLLGTLLKPVMLHNKISNKPYVIGLTGGIASGKSTVAKRLQELGAFSINCDIVAHDLYAPGKPCHTLVLEEFGDEILAENGEIDRKVLGAIVFQDPKRLQELNSLVWPAIGAAVQEMISASDSSVVVVEAAVLLTAGWQNFCHEVWSTLIPPSEAVNRIIARNGLTAEQAKARLASQPKNKMYVEGANVIICSLWSLEYTAQQVDKAWGLLQARLL